MNKEYEDYKSGVIGEDNFYQVLRTYILTRLNGVTDKEDIAQDVCMKVFTSLNNMFSEEEEIQNFTHWLNTVIKNAKMEYFRQEKMRSQVLEEEEEVTPLVFDLSVMSSDTARRIGELMIEGYSIKEIAEKLGKNVNSLYTQFHRKKINVSG